MTVSRKLRGALAGLMLAGAALGAVSLSAPSQAQAAEVSFGVFVHDRQPPARYERIPEPPRYYGRADWRPGHWEWRHRRWCWERGFYGHRDRDWRYDRHADRDWDRPYR
jgi:hypothetical protein